MKQKRAFKYRISPTNEQKQILARTFGCIRFMYNWAFWYGRALVRIDKWYPSSKRCSQCGHILASLALDVREWTCPECGTHHHRDLNAARNVHAAGLAVYACGEAIRPGAVKTTPGTLRRSRKAHS